MAFLRNVLATIIGLFIFIIIGVFIIGGIATALSTADQVDVEDKSVLYLGMYGEMSEIVPEESIEELVFGDQANVHGLINLLQALKRAKTDDRIKGIYIEHGGLQASFSAIDEMRQAIKDFKTSGKFVYSYSPYFSEADYYLASAADSVFIQPEGMIEFNGLSSNVMFLKGTFDKLGIKPEIFRVGEYKSAIETFVRKDLSAENKEQISSLLNSLQSSMLDDISRSRGVDIAELKNVSAEMLVKFPEEAVQYNLIDKASYQDEVFDIIRSKLEIEEDKKINMLSYKDYIAGNLDDDYSKNRIAVIVAEGEIVMGRGGDGQIGSSSFVKELRKVRRNDRVKGVVVRINSPGGSALASDIIWRELILLKEKKPLVASMSGVAASGGYYMSAAADSILALPGTITGSIGVFGLMANVGDFMEDKLGITFDQVGTGRYADFPNLTRPLTDSERKILQEGVNRVYDTFLSKVDAGRPIDRAEVERVAKGRVWSGQQAKGNGLVDQQGGLYDAVAVVADKIGVSDDYAMVVYPKPKNFIEQFMEELEGGITLQSILGKEINTYVEDLKAIDRYKGVQARIPFDITID